MSIKCKKRKPYLVGASLIASLALLAGVGLVSVKAQGSPLNEAVVGLAACATSNPDSKVCNTLVSVLKALLPESEESVLGGTVNRGFLSSQVTTVNALGLDCGGGNNCVQKCEATDFPNTTSTPYVLQNSSQADLQLYYLDLWIMKAPSATIAFTAGTSTNTSVPFNELSSKGTASTLDAVFNRFIVSTSSANDAHLSNYRLASSTVTEANAVNLASSTAFARSCLSGTCRVGSSIEPIVTVDPNNSFILHLESTDKQWAVTTTLSTSTPSTDPQDVRRRTEGDIGLRAKLTVCWRTTTTSTVQ